MQKVKGDHVADITLYALSTCVWCRKTKQLLKELGVEYHFIDVDLCEEDEAQSLENKLLTYRNPMAYPIILIDDQVIKGYNPNRIKEVLGYD